MSYAASTAVDQPAYSHTADLSRVAPFTHALDSDAHRVLTSFIQFVLISASLDIYS